MTAPPVAFFVPGIALPERRHPPSNKRKGSKGRQRRSDFADPWKKAVRAVACPVVNKGRPVPPRRPVFGGHTAIALGLRIWVTRPPSHYGTGRNSHRVKPSSPLFPVSLRAGDLDNIIKATIDALGDWSGAARNAEGPILWRDDAQVISYDPAPWMLYADAGHPPGCALIIRAVNTLPSDDFFDGMPGMGGAV